MHDTKRQQKTNPSLRGGSDDEEEYPWPWHHEMFLRRKLLEEGKTPAELAEDWGCCERTIWRAMAEHGLTSAYRRLQEERQ